MKGTKMNAVYEPQRFPGASNSNVGPGNVASVGKGMIPGLEAYADEDTYMDEYSDAYGNADPYSQGYEGGYDSSYTNDPYGQGYGAMEMGGGGAKAGRCLQCSMCCYFAPNEHHLAQHYKSPLHNYISGLDQARRSLVQGLRTMDEVIRANGESEPLIGLEYICQYPPNKNGLVLYGCKLCQSVYRLECAYLHIVSPKHRILYLSQHYPEMQIHPDYTLSNPSDHDHLYNCARNAEQSFGRKHIKYLDFNYNPNNAVGERSGPPGFVQSHHLENYPPPFGEENYANQPGGPLGQGGYGQSGSFQYGGERGHSGPVVTNQPAQRSRFSDGPIPQMNTAATALGQFGSSYPDRQGGQGNVNNQQGRSSQGNPNIYQNQPSDSGPVRKRPSRFDVPPEQPGNVNDQRANPNQPSYNALNTNQPSRNERRDQSEASRDRRQDDRRSRSSRSPQRRGDDRRRSRDRSSRSDRRDRQRDDGKRDTRSRSRDRSSRSRREDRNSRSSERRGDRDRNRNREDRGRDRNERDRRNEEDKSWKECEPAEEPKPLDPDRRFLLENFGENVSYLELKGAFYAGHILKDMERKGQDGQDVNAEGMDTHSKDLNKEAQAGFLFNQELFEFLQYFHIKNERDEKFVIQAREYLLQGLKKYDMLHPKKVMQEEVMVSSECARNTDNQDFFSRTRNDYEGCGDVDERDQSDDDDDWRKAIPSPEDSFSKPKAKVGGRALPSMATPNPFLQRKNFS